MKRRAWIGLLTLPLLVSPVSAWNPLVENPAGPFRWSTAGPVVWNPDNDGLGCTVVGNIGSCTLNNAAANQLVSDGFAVWDAVPTTAITFAQGAPIVNGSGIAVDVTAANYLSIIGLSNGQNPIIYDNQREIFDLIGRAPEVLGFAGLLTASGTTITKAYAVLQGDWLDGQPADGQDPGEVTQTQFLGVMVHEFGHFSGLGHSSVNLPYLLGSPLGACPFPTSEQIESMSPFLIPGFTNPGTLHTDDEIGISAMYPTAAFQANFARISGEVIARDGVNPFDGANVVVRPDTATCNALYDEAQGTQSGVNPAETGGAGTYQIWGLPPATNHTVFVTEITDGGSYPIGGTSPPLLGGPPEFYNGASEASFDPPDTPGAFSAVTTGAAGTEVPNIDIFLNNADFPGTMLGNGPEPLRVGKFDGTTGLPPELLVLDDDFVDSAWAFNSTALMTWVNRFSPGPQQTPFRLERIDVLFAPGTLVSPGRNIRLLVYVDALGTGSPAGASLVHSQDSTIQFLDLVAFNQYTLTTPVTVPAGGDVYIGVADLVGDATTNFIATFDTTPSGRAYIQGAFTTPGTNPANFSLCAPGNGLCDSDRTWMIRGFGRTVPPAGALELTWGDACNAGAVPDQEFAVYEGTLASISGTQDHAPIACGTGGRRNLILNVPPVSDAYWLVNPLQAGMEGELETGTGGLPRTPLATCGTIMPGTCP